jgi:outer membrane immunogenic protein
VKKRSAFGVVSVSVSILFSILALTFSAPTGAANAADLPAKAATPPPEPPPLPAYFNWTGFYVGGNFGGGWATSDFSGTTLFTPGGLITPSAFSGSDNLSGILGGGQIGFNYEFPNSVVIGLEADGDWSNISGSTSTCGIAAGATTGCSNNNVKIDDFGTVRGRLGYAWSNVLLYGSGGWAWGGSTTTSSLTCVGAACPATSGAFTGGNSTSSVDASGWAAGAGLEWAFTRNWTLRLEYLHLQFNGVGGSFNSSGAVAGVPFTSTASGSSNVGLDAVRVGANYLFK